ncbi:MAG: hypothetical protein ACREE2_04200 [Stellaceae bacterium]
MTITPAAAQMLAEEARALLTRLDRLRPFALVEPMVPAAGLFPNAQSAIERSLFDGRQELRLLTHWFLGWLVGPGRHTTASQAQRRFAVLKLRFQAVLNEFDMFSEAITQRSEHDNGPWLSGLDVVAADALALPGLYYELPPIICYLDRGPGAAIRRARTRLPGGRRNPVAIIQVPRERMIGSGIAGSLIHEVGHQAAALLDLVPSLRPVLQGLQRGSRAESDLWAIWERWISEIVADFWSIARVGVASTLGLIGVVSLPRPFVFRIDLDDPHPAPWLRVKLSAAIGQALYPHPQWQRLAALWEELYPPAGLDERQLTLLRRLDAQIPGFVALLVNHRPARLRGHSLPEAMQTDRRAPRRLAAMFTAWSADPAAMYRADPTIVFAALGQARADQRLSPEDESTLVGRLLTFWAMKTTLDTSYECAVSGTRLRDASLAAVEPSSPTGFITH